MLRRILWAGVLTLAVAGCGGGKSINNEDALRAQATRIAHEVIITDGHIDVPYRLNRRWQDISTRTASGEFDYVRAKEGGLDAPFMSIFTPASFEAQGRSKQVADSLIDMVEGFARDYPDKFAVASSPDQVEANFARGVISLCMGMENGSPIEGNLDNVRYFYDRGVRYITLAHSKDNHLCDSSYDTTGTWHGLSPFGEKVVAEMNRVGIMIDVSHLTDDAFWQIMKMTRAPVIASHSSCRHFLPGFERNISDDMIQAVGENGGVVQINFGSTFISQESRAWGDDYTKARDAYLNEHGYARHSNNEKSFKKYYTELLPMPRADVTDVADHIDRVVKLAGIDHVGFGSDFDGVGDTLPTGLMDVSQYPNLIYELLRRGYSRADIEKICYKNVARVWREVERVAAES